MALAIGISASVGGIDVWGDGEIHDHLLISQSAERVRFMGEGNDHLAGPNLGLLAADFEQTATLKHYEDLVTQIVTVILATSWPGSEAHQTGADLRRNQKIVQVLFSSEVVDFKSHGLSSCVDNDGLVVARFTFC